MDQGPLVNDQIEAGKDFIQRFENYAPVKAAFWLKHAEDGDWSLHVASDEINDTNFDVAYGEVLRVAAAMPEPRIDPFQVKLVVGNESLVRAMEDLQRRSQGRAVTQYYGRLFGDSDVGEVYLYPSRVTTS